MGQTPLLEFNESVEVGQAPLLEFNESVEVVQAPLLEFNEPVAFVISDIFGALMLDIYIFVFEILFSNSSGSYGFGTSYQIPCYNKEGLHYKTDNC